MSQSLAAKLCSCAVFHFDDFDDTNTYPDDFVNWWKRGADVGEFDFPGMDKAVRNCLKAGNVETVVLDYPFGRLHRCFQDIINLSVYIDTPTDVALCRRILRDYLNGATPPPEQLKAELTSYLASSRVVYLESAQRHRAEADLILDGNDSITRLAEQVRDFRKPKLKTT